MKPLRKVCHMPKEGIENTPNTESTVFDEANSGKQVSRRNKKKKKLKNSKRSNTQPLLYVGPSIVCLKKKLIVLDINGILVDIVSPPPKHREADLRLKNKALFKRPFCDGFLSFCFANFEVGIWSSRTMINVSRALKFLMGNSINRLLFCWGFPQCTKTKFKTLEHKHKPLVFKDLRKIWDKYDSNLPWDKGYYNESNTLLLDDSPYKGLLNPPYTSVFPYSYNFENQSDNSLGAGGDLRKYLAGVAEAENIQKYVEQHPFGQSAINEGSEGWNFYREVLDCLSQKKVLST